MDVMTPVKLSELIEPIEFDSDEHDSYVDLQNGSVVRLAQSSLSAIEEGEEGGGEGLEDWEKEEVETARAIEEDPGKRFLNAPGKFDFDEYRQLERFIQTVDDAQAAEQLWRAIKGSGAFRHFKNTAARPGLLESWFQYRDTVISEFIFDWAEIHHIPLVDDLKSKRGK